MPPIHPPVLEPPTQQQDRQQADPGPVQAREREVTSTGATEREPIVPITDESLEERPPGPREPTETQSTPARTPDKVDQPRRETRKPARYDDFECYALQPQEKSNKINNEDYLVTATRKKQREQEDKERNKCHLMEEEKFGKKRQSSRTIFLCARNIPGA